MCIFIHTQTRLKNKTYYTNLLFNPRFITSLYYLQAGNILGLLLILVVHIIFRFQYQLMPKATISVVLSLGFPLYAPKPGP